MLGMTKQEIIDDKNPIWIAALRDAVIVGLITFFTTLSANSVAQGTESWHEIAEYNTCGIPMFSALVMFLYSLVYTYKVKIPVVPERK